MNESTTKRRIWIRNIIIILLIVLLILTLFSNTIMESSLPEVSVMYPQYANISSRIRATANVTAKENYSVGVTQTRKVSAVSVRIGSRVSKGDTLMTLAPGDSGEVTKALEELTNLRIQLIQKKKADPALQTSSSSATGKSLETQLKSAKTDLSNAYSDLSDMRSDLADLKSELEELQQELAKLQDDLASLPTSNDVYAAEQIIALAKQSIEAYDNEIGRLQLKQQAIGKNGYYTIDELADLRQDALYELDQAEKAYTAAMAARDNAKITVKLWEDRVKLAEQAYDRASETLADYTSTIQNNGVTEASLISEQQKLADSQKAIQQAQQYFSMNEYNTARQEYIAARNAYEASFANTKLTDEERQQLKKDLDAAQAVFQPLDSKYQNIVNLQQQYAQAQQNYQQHYQQYYQSLQENALLKQLTDAQKTAKADRDSMKESLEAAKEDQTAKETAYQESVKKYDEAKAKVKEYDSYQDYNTIRDEIKELTALKEAENEKIKEAQKTIDESKDDNRKAVRDKITTKEKEITSNNKSITSKNKEISNQTNKITQYNDNIASIQAQIDEEVSKNEAKAVSGSLDEEQYRLELSKIEESIAKKEAEVEKLKALDEELVVTAPVNGIVESISATEGKDVQANSTVCVISMSENGYTMQTTVTAQQASRISVGDVGELQWYSRGQAPEIRVTSITMDPQSQGKNRIVTLSVEGENIQSGQSLTFTLGSKGQSYDCVVPNSAVREDSNGKFVLIVTAKSTPLGNRYTTKRVDVDVIASDDTKSAVSSSVQGEYVVTNSTTPISAGMQVRLSDNNS